MKKKKVFWALSYFLSGVFLLASVFLLGRAYVLNPQLKLQNTFPIKSPRKLTHAEFHPSIEDRVFICQKNGIILSGLVSEETDPELVLDIRERVDSRYLEDGLLSLEFDPNFEKNNFVYLFYIGKDPKKKVVSRFTMNAETFQIDSMSEHKLIELVHQKYGHNGGYIEFGPDGMMYVSFGDGFAFEGAHEVIQKNYQEKILGRKSFFGSILRIKPQESGGYMVPEGNPFSSGKRELWATGFRNPWRFSFYPKTNALIVADVGLKGSEEINLVTQAGQDFGWPYYEGRSLFVEGVLPKHSVSFPKADFSSRKIRSIIGGFVYQGNELSSLKGQYIFGDTYRGIYSIDLNEEKVIEKANLLLHKVPGLNPHLGVKVYEIASFAQDSQKELYVVDYNGGFYKLVSLSFKERLLGFLYQILSFW